MSDMTSTVASRVRVMVVSLFLSLTSVPSAVTTSILPNLSFVLGSVTDVDIAHVYLSCTISVVAPANTLSTYVTNNGTSVSPAKLFST